MADVVVQQQVILRITDQEWRLIMRALAFFAGLKVTNKTEDRAQAATLNQELLAQRMHVLKDQLAQAEGAYTRATNPEDDGTAAISRMAFSVGEQVGRSKERKAQEAEEEGWCPHGRLLGACDACDKASDQAYDASREH